MPSSSHGRRMSTSDAVVDSSLHGREGGTEEMGIIAVENLMLLLTFWNVLKFFKPKASHGALLCLQSFTFFHMSFES
ncbi:hypothetical protein EJB05_08544, partial [Eragrostis curvula]